MEKIVAESAEALGVESGSIGISENNHWVIRYVCGISQLQIGTRFSDEDIPASALAAREKRMIAVNDIRDAPSSDFPTAEQLGIRALMVIPLIVGDETIGILWLNNHSGPFAFGEAEIDFATKLAASISLALENVRLYEAEQAARSQQESLRARLQYQHNEMQQALLPGRVPGFDGCAIATRFVPGTAGEQASGDFYDIFRTEDGRIAVLIGDVSGKGVEAASLSAAVRSTTRAFAYELSLPGLALSHANSVVQLQEPGSERFATAFLAILDPRSGRLDYSSAGHPPAMILRADGSVELLGVPGLPLRVADSVDYRSMDSNLAPGDKLILYTDGISEARSGARMYDIDGMRRSLEGHGQMTPEEILELLFCMALDISAGRLTDDAVVIVVKRNPV